MRRGLAHTWHHRSPANPNGPTSSSSLRAFSSSRSACRLRTFSISSCRVRRTGSCHGTSGVEGFAGPHARVHSTSLVRFSLVLSIHARCPRCVVAHGAKTPGCSFLAHSHTPRASQRHPQRVVSIAIRRSHPLHLHSAGIPCRNPHHVPSKCRSPSAHTRYSTTLRPHTM